MSVATTDDAFDRTMRLVYAARGMPGLGRHLEDRYKISVANVVALDAGVYRIDCGAGSPWVARVFHPDRLAERAIGDARLLEFLAAHDLPAERVACADPVSVLDGQAVLVTEFVAGATPRPSARTLARIAAVLGGLHCLPADAGVAAHDGGSLHHVPGYEGLPGRDLALAATMLARIDNLIPVSRRGPFVDLRRQVAEADDCADLPRALVHPDPVLKNVIDTGGGRLVLVDWAGAGYGPRIASVAVLLRYALKRDGWDATLVQAIAGAYAQHVRLEPEEVQRIGAPLRIRQLWFAAWRYWARTSAGNPPTGKEWWMPSRVATDNLVEVAASAFAAR